MPCATPPWIWPSTIIGLITRPQSCTTTYRLISTCAVSGSTSTTIAWTPFAVLPRSGPKYAVASSPGSAPGRTAPRSGFAFSASVPSAMPPFESPRRCTRPPASTRSAGAAASSRLASSRIFSRTRTAAAWQALPATTAPRLANVPVPQGDPRGSPVTTCTSPTSPPSPPPASEHQIGGRRCELAARELEDLLANTDGGRMAGATGHDGAAAGKRARATVELPRIARHDVHLAHVHAEHLGHDLGEHGEVALPLRPHAGRQADAPARLDGDARALVGPDSRPLDVAHHADPHVPAGRPQAPLLLAQEAFVIDGLERLVERRLVVAAVVRERRGVLEQDLVVERELVGPE